MNISDAVSDFILAKKANGRAAQTISDYHRCLDPFADWCRKQHRDADSLTRPDFRRYVAEELRTQDWAESTIAIHVRVLRCFLRWIYEEGYTDDNLAEAVAAPSKRTKVEIPLSSEEVERLLSACHGDDILDRRDLAIILTFLDTGLRLKELTRLRRDQVTIDEGRSWIMLEDAKTGQTKFALLGKTATAALASYLRIREDDHPTLWMGRRGPLTKQGIYRAVKRRARDAGLKRVHPHLFRKTFATWWIRSGGDQTRLQELAGWASEEMLKIYVLLASREDLEEAHRKFGPVDRMVG